MVTRSVDVDWTQRLRVCHRVMSQRGWQNGCVCSSVMRRWQGGYKHVALTTHRRANSG